MINALIEILMVKTVGLSLLTLIILAIRPLVLKKLNAGVAYGLWLMLPLFLILPQALIEQTVNSPVMTFFPGVGSLMPSITAENVLESLQAELFILVVWVFGILLSLGLYISRYQKLTNSLTNFDYQLPVQQLTQNSKFKPQFVAIKNTKLVDMPAVFGLMKANLILPSDFHKQSEHKQLMILRHEFYHLARHDHQVNFLRVLIKSIFWFNPLIFWADKFVEADQEISCDLGVLKNSPQSEKKSYAKALVESIGSVNQNYLVSQWKYQSLIKQRVKMLKNTNQKKWHSWAAAGIVVTSIWTTSMVVAGEKIEAKHGDVIPIVVIEPHYPRKAAMEGVEGEVRFEFTVAKSGRVVDPIIVQSIPEGVFDKDALKAISQWKFKPRIVNGNPVEQKDMLYTMEFKLFDDDNSPTFPPKPEANKN